MTNPLRLEALKMGNRRVEQFAKTGHVVSLKGPTEKVHHWTQMESTEGAAPLPVSASLRVGMDGILKAEGPPFSRVYPSKPV